MLGVLDSHSGTYNNNDHYYTISQIDLLLPPRCLLTPGGPRDDDDWTMNCLVGGSLLDPLNATAANMHKVHMLTDNYGSERVNTRAAVAPSG